MNELIKTEAIETTCEPCESKYYTLRAVKETSESIKRNIDTYNDKFVKKPIDAGRQFIKDLNAEPLKTIDGLIDNSKNAAKSLKAESMQKYGTFKFEIKDKTKEFADKFKASPFNAIGEVVKETKEDAAKKIDGYLDVYKENKNKIVENLEKDVVIAKQDIIDATKKALDKIGIKKVIEEKVSSTVEKLPSMLNLPSKQEVEELIKGIDSVNRKVDSLTKEFITA
ncbi:MAG: hypothetical protein HQK71_10195 [Desulfamplus sp.]|nr:hypothetical protein [Desulfamplus sp.]